MGQMMEIIELRGQVERKDAHIDKLQLDLDIATKDKSESAELAARLFTENQKLKKQLNDKQLEVEHCHVVCGELRQSLEQMKSLATAGANCAIAAAQDGIEVAKERDALAAQVEVLRDAICKYPVAMIPEVYEALFPKTPAACLAQVKAGEFADGGLAQKAFWEGFERGTVSHNKNIRAHWSEWSEFKMAERIRQEDSK